MTEPVRLQPIHIGQRPTREEATRLFVAIRRLIALRDQYARGTITSATRELQRRPIKPGQHQTRNGLYLAFSHGLADQPISIWTPYGERLIGSVHDKVDTEAFLAHLAISGHTLVHKAVGPGTHGPVFAVHAVDELALPHPILPISRQDYLATDQALKEWRALEPTYPPT